MAGTVLRSLAATGLTLSFLIASVSVASAFPLRDPQVEFSSEDLQRTLGPINALTDQLDAQVWDVSAYFNPTFTLYLEFFANTPFNAIGVYNTTVPISPLFSIFPGTTSVGWFALAHFAGGGLTVTLFDQNSVVRSHVTYPGVNANAFGFYLVSPAGTFYSEDSRNGGSPRALTYAGMGVNSGIWWECFEASTDPTGSANFDDVVLLVQPTTPVPINTSTWGRLKSLYRQ